MAEGDHPRALSRCRSLHLLYHTTTGTPLYHTYHTSTTPDSLAGRGPGLRAVVAVEVSDQASVSLDECFLGNTTGSLRWRAEWVRPPPLRLPPNHSSLTDCALTGIGDNALYIAGRLPKILGILTPRETRSLLTYCILPYCPITHRSLRHRHRWRRIRTQLADPHGGESGGPGPTTTQWVTRRRPPPRPQRSYHRRPSSSRPLPPPERTSLHWAWTYRGPLVRWSWSSMSLRGRCLPCPSAGYTASRSVCVIRPASASLGLTPLPPSPPSPLALPPLLPPLFLPSPVPHSCMRDVGVTA